VFDAAECFDGRLPELFTGIERSEFPRPVRFPTSCSPQAWASATPLLLLRSLLRFDPVLPCNEVYADPALPASIEKLRVGNVSLADARVTLSADRQGFTLAGLPEDVTVVRSGRHSSEN
jgi:glycogen debranching enzyme